MRSSPSRLNARVTERFYASSNDFFFLICRRARIPSDTSYVITYNDRREKERERDIDKWRAIEFTKNPKRKSAEREKKNQKKSLRV